MVIVVVDGGDVDSMENSLVFFVFPVLLVEETDIWKKREGRGFYLILDRVLHLNDGFFFLSLILFDDW